MFKKYMKGEKGINLLKLFIDKSQLTDLSFDRGDEALCTLARALDGNSTVKTLNLSSNYLIGHSGIGELARILQTNSTLESLDLNNARIGDDVICSLAKALENNSTLTLLKLNGNVIGDGGAQALLELLKKQENLTVELNGNKISSDLAEQLVKTGRVKLDREYNLPENENITFSNSGNGTILDDFGEAARNFANALLRTKFNGPDTLDPQTPLTFRYEKLPGGGYGMHIVFGGGTEDEKTNK